MPRLILHFCQQDHLPAQAGGARNPGALGELPDDLAMRVLGDHADQLAAIFGRHPIAGFDFFASGDACFELPHLFFIACV
jgi:hypothetical protein